MKPINLSDGTHLLPGTNLLTPLAGVALDERYFPNPEVFDGLRFWRLRQQQQQQQQQQKETPKRPTTPNYQTLSYTNITPDTTPDREPSPPTIPTTSAGSKATTIITTTTTTSTGIPTPPNSFTPTPSPPQSPLSPSTSPPSPSSPSTTPTSIFNTNTSISNKYQFTSIGDTSQDFGLGRHACPGRFFASQEIKLILAYLLLNYEIKFPPAERKGDTKGEEEEAMRQRPKPIVFMMTKSPCQDAEVLFRKRRRGGG
jgi:hypothetical protein